MKEPLIKTTFYKEKRADGTAYHYAKVAIAVNKNFWNRLAWKNYVVYRTDRYSHYLSQENRFSTPIKNIDLELTKKETQEAIDNWMKIYLAHKVISTEEI